MAEPAPLRFLPAGAQALLVELQDLSKALTLLDLLLADPQPGVDEVIPAARTVLLRFDPFTTSSERLRKHILGLDLSRGTDRGGQDIDIPVSYDGPDLAEVAELLGWSVETLIRRHQQAVYKVAFSGFAPGFAYLSGSDPEITAPRRQSPRVRIPAGSVALAGSFCGIYPSDSPGGWQLLGRTELQMWSLDRPRPALLAPGDRVRFRDITKGAQVLLDAAPARPAASVTPAPLPPGLTVTRADRPALFEDFGRFGQSAQGVSRSGAVDRKNLRLANELVGNAPGEPALEISLGGFALKAEVPVTLALTGADAPMTIRRQGRGDLHPPLNAPFALDAGDELVLATPKLGLFCYLALRGGYQVTPVLGSASYDTLAKIGPLPITTGAHLTPAQRPAKAVLPAASPAPLPSQKAEMVLDVILGPRDDWFTEAGLNTFTSQAWQVTPESSRTGKRLSGATPIQRRDRAELASEACLAGSIQIPHNGQPVLFLADHPLTGGYPVIAVVAPHHLDLAAQIPPGARIRFRPIQKAE